MSDRNDRIEALWRGSGRGWHDCEMQVERESAAAELAAMTAERDDAARLLGEVCCAGTLRPGERLSAPSDHAAVRAIVGMAEQRDAALRRAERAERLCIVLHEKVSGHALVSLLPTADEWEQVDAMRARLSPAESEQEGQEVSDEA